MTQVVSHREQFEAANMNILMISFGTAYWANAWLDETQSPYPLLLDQDRAGYRAYGLSRSVLRSWGVKNLWYYAKAALQGKTFAPKRGDTNQLGGDFVIDPQGVIRLVYPSHDPTDRPSIEALLSSNLS